MRATTKTTPTTTSGSLSKSEPVNSGPQTEADGDDNDDVGDEDWEDVSSEEEEEEEEDLRNNRPTAGMNFTKQNVTKSAEETNTLLKALISHPQFNQYAPQTCPKPLWFAADFVRRTYIEYLMPLLPDDAVYKSSRFANPNIIGYSDTEAGRAVGGDRPCPTDPADDWLADNANWPRNLNSKKNKELYSDAVSRTMMICMCITDPVKGAMIMQGRFDWERPVDIAKVVRDVMGRN